MVKESQQIFESSKKIAHTWLLIISTLDSELHKIATPGTNNLCALHSPNKWYRIPNIPVNDLEIHTLFIATIALVAPFIPVEIDVLAYSACEYKNKKIRKMNKIGLLVILHA